MNPNILSSNNPAASWHANYEYRYNSTLSSTGETVYSLAFIGGVFVGGSNGIHSIKVVHSTNTWEDYGSSEPDDPLTVNGSSIECYSGSTLKYSFLKPTVADWISSGGGGTSTEEVVLNENTSGTIKKVFCNFW